MRRAAMTLAAAAVVATGCGDRGPLPLDPGHHQGTSEDRLAPLRRWEQETRRETDFAALEPFESRSGSNPQRLALLPDGGFVALLRGADELVRYDGDGNERERIAAPPSPIDFAFAGGELLVVGEGSGVVARYRLGDRLERAGDIPVPDAVSLRAIAAAGGAVHVADEATGAILELGEPGREIDRCHGPIQLERAAGYLIANCLLDHELRIWRLGAEPERIATVRHDGPIWSFAAAADGDALTIAAAGVEDRSLDRSVEGSFGFIDSFAFAYVLEGGKLRRVAEINVGEHGLVTPRWIALEASSEATVIRAASYGGDRMLELRWDGAIAGAPTVRGRAIAPGVTDVIAAGDTLIAANPLFDHILVGAAADGPWRSIAVAPADPRDPESRVGELLFFTKLMAPWSESTGRKSRFSCEACHFEGYVDGRVHFTGRDDVSATSRSLRGLFNNRPHFSRALDRTTAGMVDNEFKVANKLSGKDHWFSLRPADFPWLAGLGVDLPETMTPDYLRRALMLFLRDFTNRPSPFARGRDRFTDIERHGAELFRRRCESCHSARLITDEPASRVDFADWERHIFSPTSAIVWSSEKYQRTGITPYVHEHGSRSPSLRRLYKKWPYFTNGSAASIAEIIEQVRFTDRTVVHKGLESGQRFTDEERRALESFLKLL
jgi:hypothetical protein